MKKKIYVQKDYYNALINNLKIGDCIYSDDMKNRNLEEDVDDVVKGLLKSSFGNSVVGKKTGNSKIDKLIPSYHGESGVGKPDVMLYNYFGNNEISLIVEDKNFTSTEDALQQAIHYASVGEKINKPIRVVIGNNPNDSLKVRVLVNGKYEILKVNGKEINYFFSSELLNLIYENPDVNDFVIEELVENPFTQKDFHNIINRLKQVYRIVTEIGNNDDVVDNTMKGDICQNKLYWKQKIYGKK